VVTLIGASASFGWGLALGFSLALVSLASVLTLSALPKGAMELTVGPVQKRTFKGAEVSTSLTIGTVSGKDVAQLELAVVPEGLDASISGEGASRLLRASSRFAGVFGGLKVTVGVRDPLRIFVRKETYDLALAFEFLPTYLLARREPLRVSAAMLGDYPAGRGGFGQEFYSAEVYTPSSPSRDIMWKRQAKMPNDSLMVRVGEANIPEKLTVCFIERREVQGRSAPWWMDLASEALARVGLPVVASGTTLRLLHILEEKTTVAEARDPSELASLLVGLWRHDEAKEHTDSDPSEADIVVAREVETKDPRTFKLVLEKPSVILSGGNRSAALGSSVVFFTGHEDVSGLVARVLSK
jgi:uncharacterized protein (DUF58 family)